jgi:Holliday junction resolvase-like predicted endonuclease
MNDKGQAAENFAAEYLKAKGLKLISTNYRSRFGEID